MYFEYEQCYITFYVLFIALPTMIEFRYIKSRRPQIFTQQIISKAINLTMIFACMVYSFFLKITSLTSFLLVLKLFRALTPTTKGGVYGRCVLEVKLYWGTRVHLYTFHIAVLSARALIVRQFWQVALVRVA